MFTISNATMKVCDEHAEIAFWHRMRDYVIKTFGPQLLAHRSLEEILLQRRKECRSWRIVTERGMFQYTCLGFLCGEAIYCDASMPEMLRNKEVPPDASMDMLYKTLDSQF